MSDSINSHQYSIDSPLYSVPTKPSIPNIPLLLKKKTLTVDNENENVELKKRKLDKQNFPISKVDDHQFLKPITSVVKKNQENLNVSIHKVEEHQIEFSNKVLGEGAQGIVRMGKYCNGIVAIKSMQKGRYEKMIMREIKLLDKITHVNIIAISAYCSAATQFHIVMEYFKSSNLNDIIFTKDIREKFDLNLHKKNEIAYQISCGLTYLHMQPTPIIHRDIKPGNILVSDDLKVKICDLGLAKGGILSSNLVTTCICSLKGTYVFMAPELILKRKEVTVYSDVWSFAVTLVELYNQDHCWEPSLFFCNILIALTNLFNRSKIPDTKLIPSFLKSKVLQCFSYSDISRPPAKDLLLLLEKECGYSMKTTELSDF